MDGNYLDCDSVRSDNVNIDDEMIKESLALQTPSDSEDGDNE